MRNIGRGQWRKVKQSEKGLKIRKSRRRNEEEEEG